MRKGLALLAVPFSLLAVAKCGSGNPVTSTVAGSGASTGSASGSSTGGGTGGSGSLAGGSGVAGGSGSTSSGVSGTGGTSGNSSGASAGSGGGGASGSSGSAGGGTGSSGSSNGVPNGAGASVLMHHNHMNRDGLFIDPKLTKAAAATMHNDAAFMGKVTGGAFATPLFLEAGKVPALNGGKGVVFVATEANHVVALDEMTGAVVWDKTVGTPGTPNIGPCCGLAIKPQGVTGTPAIDLASSLIVMDAAQGPGLADHVVYGLDLATGATKFPPVSLTGVKDSKGRTFGPTDHEQRSAVLIVPGASAATTFAYFTFAGNIGDQGAYFGWVIGVPLDGNKTNIKAWRTDAAHSGIWGPGGPSSDGRNVFVTTGNAPGGSAWGQQESVIKLGLDLAFSGAGTDYFTPGDWQMLDRGDTDISGSGPVVLDAPGMPKKLVLALGKDGNAYLIDPANMGGMGGTIVAQATVSHGAISNAAAWASIGGKVYVVANNNWTAGSGCALAGMDKNGGNNQNDNLFMFTIDASNAITEVWCGNSGGHTSPIITTTDGTSEPIVWVGGGSAGNGGPGDNKLHAFDLLNGVEIPNTASVAGMATLSSSLMAAGGRIYAASTQGTLYAVTP